MKQRSSSNDKVNDFPAGGKCTKVRYPVKSKKKLRVENIIELGECVLCVKDDLMQRKRELSIERETQDSTGRQQHGWNLMLDLI